MAKKAKRLRKGTLIAVTCLRCGVEAVWKSGGEGKADMVTLPAEFDRCPRLQAMMTFDENFDLLEFQCETLMDEVDKKTQHRKTERPKKRDRSKRRG